MYYILAKFLDCGNVDIFRSKKPLEIGGKYIFTINGNRFNEIVTIVKCEKISYDKIEPYIDLIEAEKYVEGYDRIPNIIKKVYYNDVKGATTVIWIDGSKTTVHCDIDDKFDLEKGITMCIVKKIHGNHGYFNDYINDAIKSAVNTNKGTKSSHTTTFHF